MRHKLKFCSDIYKNNNLVLKNHQAINKDISSLLLNNFFSEKFLKKQNKINFIHNFNFLKKNFFLKNSQTLFKFSLNINRMYQLPLFFIKKFNFSKKIQKTYSQTMTSLLWYFSAHDFEFFVKYLFNSTLMKFHKNIFSLLQNCFNSIGSNFSEKLVYVSIIFKGKLSGVGNSRKRSLKLSKGPFYNKIKPRIFLKKHLSVKVHYFFLYTITGVSSVTTVIKHIR